MFKTAAAVFAEHAEAVGVIDHEKRARRCARLRQIRQRRDIAIHTEHAVGHDQCASGLAGCAAIWGPSVSACGIAAETRAAEQACIQQRSVVKAVLQHPVAAAQQCAGDAQVRHVAGGEQQCPGSLRELGQFVFECCVGAAVTGDEMGSTAAGAVLIERRPQPCARPDARQAQIIVAGEIEITLAVDVDLCTLGPVQHAPQAIEGSGFQRFEIRAGAARQVVARRSLMLLRSRDVQMRWPARSCKASAWMPRRANSSPVLLHVRVAGGQQLLAVEDGVGAGEERQRLHLVVHLARPADRRTWTLGMRMRATAITRTKSKGSTASRPAAACLPPAPAG